MTTLIGAVGSAVDSFFGLGIIRATVPLANLIRPSSVTTGKMAACVDVAFGLTGATGAATAILLSGKGDTTGMGGATTGCMGAMGVGRGRGGKVGATRLAFGVFSAPGAANERNQR